MTTIWLGDVHLGKKFETGVPLHRRGDREKFQFAQFEASLQTDAEIHVQMGDLFDKMQVPYAVIWSAAQAYWKVAGGSTKYVVIRGNHDASRDADRVSAFQIFAELVRPKGIVVVDEEPIRIGDEVFIPWHPFLNARDMVLKYEDLIRGAHTVYGHWDVVMGQDNQLPAAELLAAGVKLAVTGHDHTPRSEKLHGLDVTVTGSMQPYSHGEDPNGFIYITVSLTELLKDLEAVKHKCVRLVLEPTEQLDIAVDCLQLQVQRKTVDETLDMGEVAFEEFDLQALYGQAVLEIGLSDDISALALERLEAERGK
jgi:predicted phosphodiesterase